MAQESHSRIDLAKFNHELKEVELRKPNYNLYTIESLLRNKKLLENSPEGILTSRADLFLWQRERPRVGGYAQLCGDPVVHADFQWPSLQGKPAKFWGSFDFSESLDLIDRKLPGDVLNIFLFDTSFATPNFAASVWCNRSDAIELAADRIPANVKNEHTLYGRPVRFDLIVGATMDSPAVAKFLSQTCKNDFIGITSRHPFLELGFAPYPFKPRSDATLIAAGCSFQPAEKWPLLDQEEPIDPQTLASFVKFDGFFLVFMREDGSIDFGYGRG